MSILYLTFRVFPNSEFISFFELSPSLFVNHKVFNVKNTKTMQVVLNFINK